MAGISNTEPTFPSERDIGLAKESGHRLASMLGNSGEGLRLGLLGLVGQDTEIVLPPSAARLLVDLLSNMAEGNGVSLIPVRAELTTQQAADLLNVSRKFLIDELLNGGALPYRKVGTHRRIPLRDLLNYKQDNRAKRLAAIDEMVENDQSIGLY